MSEEPGVILRNRRAFYDFTIIDKIECGIALNGDEVKAVRAKTVQFSDSFVRVERNQLYIHNLSISAYRHRDVTSAHDALRVRKLLAHKQEIKKMHRYVTQKGNTLVPLDIHLSSRRLIKLTVAIAKGKKTVDKRQEIKSRDIQRDTVRELKGARVRG